MNKEERDFKLEAFLNEPMENLVPYGNTLHEKYAESLNCLQMN